VAIASKEWGGDMEARIARLGSDVAHIRADVGDLKGDVRSLREKMDALRDKMDERFAQLAESLASAKIWALVLYIALAGSLFGVLARGFGWL
jgi:outer membrane murein-binding lipoprotein Lpp